MQRKEPKKHQICCICHKVPEHRQILPCCNCVCCKRCLANHLDKSIYCPNCNAQLKRNKAQAELCEYHKKSLDYFCKTCNQKLCSDCLFEQIQNDYRKHPNHDIVKISELKNEIKREEKRDIKKEMKNMLENDLRELNKLDKQITKKLKLLNKQNQTLQITKEDIKYQSHGTFRVLQEHLENQYKQKQLKYKETTYALEKEMDKFQTLLEEGELILTSDDPKIVPAAQNYIQKLKNFSEEVKPQSIEPPLLKWNNELVPPFQTMEVRIDDFKKHVEEFKGMKESDNRFLYSESKTMFGGVWRAKIYPNGNQCAINTHLSVYIELLKGVNPPAEFYYQVEIMPANKHQQAISKHYTSVFEPMDSWGWNKMAPLDVLYKGYIDSNDTVTLMISLRPESYMVYAQQTKREYEILRNKYKKLKNSDDTEKKIERYPTDE